MNEVEAALDRASWPLRHTIGPWATRRGLGFSSYFDRARRLWIFDIYEVFVIGVDEDGEEARVMVGKAVLAKATTPTGLRRAMNRLYDAPVVR